MFSLGMDLGKPATKAYSYSVRLIVCDNQLVDFTNEKEEDLIDKNKDIKSS